MICDECYEDKKQKVLGKPTTDGGNVIDLAQLEFGTIWFSGGYKPYYRLFYKSSRVLKNGKVKETKFHINHIAKFCAECGKNLAF